MVIIVLKIFAGSSETAAKLGSAAVSRNTKEILSTIAEIKDFYHTGRDIYYELFV